MNRGMKSLGLATGGLLSVAKMLGRVGGVSGKEGRLWGPRLKEARKLEFRKRLEVGLPMFWPMVSDDGCGELEVGLPDTLERWNLYL